MSLTIHNCSNMTTVDLRERRRQKILQNAEKRLSTILKGPNGDEKRQLPCIDGFTSSNEERGSDVEEKIYYDEQYIDLQSTTPVSCGFVERHRFWIIVAFGLFLRLAVMLELINYVFLSFTAIFLQLELFVYFSQKTMFRRYPLQDYLVNMLMVTKLNEKLILCCQFVINFMWDFVLDACLMSFSFLCFHLVLLRSNI